MSERASMIHPPIEDLLDKVDSKFSLVSLAAKRGRQINSYFSQLGEGLGAIVPPQVASVSRKPLTIALEEIAANKITFVRIEEPVEGEEAAPEAVSAVRWRTSAAPVSCSGCAGRSRPTRRWRCAGGWSTPGPTWCR